MFKKSILLLLVLPFSAFAREKLTLDEAIERALKHNFDIRVAKVDADKAKANNTMGNAGMLPYLGATGSVNKGTVTSEIQFSDGRVQNVNNAGSYSYNAGVTLNWTLFDGGRMFILKKQLGVYEAIGDVLFKQQIQSMVSQTIQLYAQVVWQQQQGIAIDTGLALAKVRMDLSQLKYETGSSAKVDFLQARVDYNARQSDSLNQQSALTTAAASLNMLMGEDAEQIYDVDNSLAIDTTLQPTEPERLRDVNFTLDAARRTAYASKLGVNIARSYYLPSLGLVGSYNYSHSESQSGFATQSTSQGPSGGLNLNVPIFQGGNTRRAVKVASLQAMRDELLYNKQSTELSREYRTAWFNYQTSVSAYRLEVQNISFAKENMDIQEARFRVGVATTLETREAENSYVQALLRYYTAIYNLKVSETKVLELEEALVK